MALPLPAQDAELVTLARRGREDAFGALYERYFPGVYDFLTRLLRDRQEAADVAQDTFIKAFERLGHLEKPESFKSWLFTIAHRNGLNRIERSKRAQSVGDFYVSEREAGELGVADPDRAGDPERSAEAQAAASLIWEAAAGLDPRTYSVMDLHVRQGLDSAEIAEVLGVSKGNAYTMVSRMKKSFSQTLSTYLLVRNGSADCDGLAGLVADQPASGLTPDLRKSVDRHAKSCEVCRENRKVLFMPIKMFAALGMAPVPAGLKAAIWGSVQAGAIGGAGGATGAATAPGAAGTQVAAAATPAAATPAAATPAAATQAAPTTGALVWAKAHAGGFAAAAVLIAILFVGGYGLLRNNDPAAGTDVLSSGLTPETTATLVVASTAEPEPTAPDPAPTETTQSPQVAVPAPSTTLAPPVIETTSTTSTTSTVVPPTTLVPPALVVVADRATVEEDKSVMIDVLANDSGYARGAAPEIAAPPIHGSARVSGSSIWYSPTPDYAGSDQFAYAIRGANGTKRSAQVTLTIAGVNDIPTVPGPGELSIDEDASVIFDPLAGAFDVDGDGLEMISYDEVSTHGGRITLGSLEYTPAANWSGRDVFTYVVSDGTAEVVVEVTISVAAVNDLPSGPPPILEAVEDGTGTGDILEGWSDVEGEMVFIANPGTRATARGGSVTVESDGTALYTSPPDYSGSDNFDVRVSDGTDTVKVNVLVHVAGSNDPPIVEDASFTVAETTALGQVIGVVSAIDPEGEDVHFEPLSTAVIEISSDGTVVLVAELDFEEQTRHRLDALASDDDGGTTPFFIFLYVEDVDEAPVVNDVGFSVAPGTAADTRVGTVNAKDPEGAEVTFALEGAGGLVRINWKSGVLRLNEDADPADFPITATIVVADPAGNEGRARLTLLLEDSDGPDITNFAVDVDEFYEPPAGGGVCPERPRFATYTANITDPTGVQGADLIWRVMVAGEEITGVAKMVFMDDHYEVEFTAPRGVLTDGNISTLFAKVRARDTQGNVSESSEIGTPLLPCFFG